MSFIDHSRNVTLAVLIVLVYLAKTFRISVHGVASLQDRAYTMRIPSKYNEEHPECLIRSIVSNISPDDGSDDPHNMWAWPVKNVRILANRFAGHWSIVFETFPPSAPQQEKRFVAMQRVIDWDSKTKALHDPCNHAEISIHTDEQKAVATAGNNKMSSEKYVTDMHRDDGSNYMVRDIVHYATAVMASAPMAALFSWSSNNCRDFVRHLAMNLGIVKHASSHVIWGFDELFTQRDYLDPALRELCNEQSNAKHKEACFCKSQMSWNFLHSCSKSSRCYWDESNLRCLPICSDAANQNKVNCENAAWGSCIWSLESQTCSFSS